jgi:sterol 3beta-glucosyltransferase
VKELDMSASPSNTESSAAVQSIEESNVSASQILSGSEVFRAPVPTSPTTPMGEHSASKQQKEARQGSDSSRHNLRDPPPLTGRADNQGPATLLSGSSSALTNIAAYPLQKASGLAGFLRTRSKRVSGLLASESMGYYEKVSGMLAGGRKHYHTVDALEADDRTHDLEDDEDAAKAAEHFREHFALGEGEQLQSSFFASLQRVLPNYGKIYISNRYFCFRSLMPTSKTKVRCLSMTAVPGN